LAGRASIIETVTRLAAPLCDAAGLTLVDVEHAPGRGGGAVRVVVDKPGGVRLDDLEGLHRQLVRELAAADPEAGSHSLELSSPGLDRVLKKDREFDLFRGREVEVRTYGPVDGRREFVGVLDGLVDGCVVVLGPGGERWRLPRAQVAKARLHPRF
jgi:ribosome maturation factor RimP